MRSEQFKSVNDRELAEQYLAMDEEDKSLVEKEIIVRFVAAKAKPRTVKGAAKNMIPVIIGLYLGGLLVFSLTHHGYGYQRKDRLIYYHGSHLERF